MGEITELDKYFVSHNHKTQNFDAGVCLFAQVDAFNSAKQKPGRD